MVILNTPQPSRHGLLAVGVVCLLLAAGVRFWRIGERSLWEDELSTWTSTRGSIMDGIRYVQMPHPPLYSLSVRATEALSAVGAGGSPAPQVVPGESPAPQVHQQAARPGEAVLRAPSAVYGVAGVAAVGWLGAMMFGRRVAAAAMVAAAFNTFLIKYSQEARMYTLLCLTAALSTGAWYRWVIDRRRGYAFAYAAATTAMFYTHYFAALVVAAQAAWGVLMFLSRGLQPARGLDSVRGSIAQAETRNSDTKAEARVSTGPPRRRLALMLAPMAAAVALFSPLAVFFVLKVLPNKISWIPALGTTDYLAALGRMMIGPAEPAYGAAKIGGGIEVAGLIVLGLAAAGVAIRRRDEPDAPAMSPGECESGDRRWNLAQAEACGSGRRVARWLAARPAETLLALWALASFGGLVFLSELVRPTFVARYAIAAIVPLTLLVLAAVHRLRGRLLWLACAFLAANGVVETWTRLQAPVRPDGLRSIIEHLNRAAGPEDAAVIVDMPFCPSWINPVDMAFEYYGLRPDIDVLHIRGDLATSAITSDEALADPRNLHVIALRGDMQTAIRRRGRNFRYFRRDPYVYYQVLGTDVSGRPAMPYWMAAPGP